MTCDLEDEVDDVGNGRMFNQEMQVMDVFVGMEVRSRISKQLHTRMFDEKRISDLLDSSPRNGVYGARGTVVDDGFLGLDHRDLHSCENTTVGYNVYGNHVTNLLLLDDCSSENTFSRHDKVSCRSIVVIYPSWSRFFPSGCDYRRSDNGNRKMKRVFSQEVLCQCFGIMITTGSAVKQVTRHGVE